MDYMKFFWIPDVVWFYVIVPIIFILLIYLIFSLVYKKKKGTRYYNYVVDYVYSTLGIIFCGLLLALLLGYSIATFQILIENNVLSKYIILDILLVILPIIPAAFLVYLIKIYLNNLKRKEKLNSQDNNIDNEKYNKLDDIVLIKKKK